MPRSEGRSRQNPLEPHKSFLSLIRFNFSSCFAFFASTRRSSLSILLALPWLSVEHASGTATDVEDLGIVANADCGKYVAVEAEVGVDAEDIDLGIAAGAV